MPAAAQSVAGPVLPLAAFFRLTENSPPGHRLPTAILYQGFCPAISKTATGFEAFLYDAGRRPRCTGKERDAESGLDYFGFRYMASAQGRFTSPDPDNFDARLGLPQSWNMYGYTINNPLKYTDNDGRFFNLGTAAVGAAVGATINVASYAISQYETGQDFNWGTAGELAAVGAGTGALAGFTFGASLAANAIGSVAIGTTANVINGAATRAIEGEDVFDEDKVTSDMATGFIGSAAGATVYMVGTAASMGVRPAAPSPLATVRSQLRHLAKLKAWEAARGKLDTNFARLGAVTGGLLAGAIDQLNQAGNRAQQAFTSVLPSWQSFLTFGPAPCTESWDTGTNTLHGCN
jgi:RHS repeat-associated protein